MDENDFEQAAKQKPLTMPAEFWMFLKENKKWWLLPIVAFLLVFGLLATFAGTAAAVHLHTVLEEDTPIAVHGTFSTSADRCGQLWYTECLAPRKPDSPSCGSRDENEDYPE